MNDNCFVIIRTCDNQETKGYINLFMVLLKACPTFEPTFESAMISTIQNKQLTHSRQKNRMWISMKTSLYVNCEE